VQDFGFFWRAGALDGGVWRGGAGRNEGFLKSRGLKS